MLGLGLGLSKGRVLGVAPSNTVAPVISGNQWVGQTLTSTTGTWTGSAPISYSYQWYRNGSPIVGATSSTYVLVQADAGNTTTIYCVVTASNGFLPNGTAQSNTLTFILDLNAYNFLNFVSLLSDATIKAAINNLVLDYKGLGPNNATADLWTDSYAIYPMVGGSASTCKGNLKDPRDLDAAFRLSFVGGWTFASTGVTGNGVDAYANTFFNTNTNGLQDTAGLSFYSRTNIAGVTIVMGNRSGSNFNEISPAYGGTTCYGAINGAEDSYADTDSRGYYRSNRIVAGTFTMWKNGSKKKTSATASATPPAYNLYIGAYNNAGTEQKFSVKECAFSVIDKGLSDANAAIEYTIVQAFETALSRQV